jgi:hypothetical protein
LNPHHLTLRRFRGISPDGEGVFAGDDEDAYNPLPAFINGS